MGRNVPQLRFPEFTAEWEEKTLRGICDIKMCKRVMKHDTAPTGEIPFFKIGTLGGEPDAYISRALFEELKTKYNYPLTGEVMMTCSGTTGNCIQFDGEDSYYQDSNIVWVSNDEKIYNNDFLYHFFKQYKWNALEGGTIKRIYTNDIYNANIPTPCKKEQEKISQFLSKYDKLIRNQEEKISALKERKQGLLKKIFTQQVRFKDQDGNDYPAWEEKTLGDICTVYDGTHQTPNYVDSGIKFVSVENIDNIYKSNKYITENAFEKEFKVYPERGDILITRIGDIGTPALVTKDEKIAYYVSLALFKNIGNGINAEYLLQYIGSNKFKRELWLRTLHTACPMKINKGDIADCVVYCPCEQEQKKIAEVLSAFDKKIEIEQEILSNMQEFKKGLLQKMFI